MVLRNRTLRFFIGVILIMGAVGQPGSVAGSDTPRPSSVTFVIGQNSFTVDGQSESMDAVPYIENGRTFIPVRYLAAAMGVIPGDIQWESHTQQVQLKLGSTRVQLQVGSYTLRVNAAQITMDVAPALRDGRVYLPARWVAQAFGYEVNWDAARSALVLTPVRRLRVATLLSVSKYPNLAAEFQRGAALATAMYENQFRAYGFPLELVHYDDQGLAKTAAEQAALIDADPTVVGVVGPQTLHIARNAAPVLAAGSVVMVSPASTSADSTSQGWAHYNRLVASDAREGPASARFASQLGVKSAYLLYDGGAYGASLVEGFAREAVDLGITVRPTMVITARDAALDRKLTDVMASRPDLVFYGGFSEDAGPTFKGLRALGFTGYLMGGGALNGPDLARVAGDAANGVYMVEQFLPQESLGRSDGQEEFVAEYWQQYSKQPSVFAALAYDATSVILSATLQLLQVHPGQIPARADIAAAVRATQGFSGLAGEVTFDAKGDNIAARMWLYQLSNGTYHLVADITPTGLTPGQYASQALTATPVGPFAGAALGKGQDCVPNCFALDQSLSAYMTVFSYPYLSLGIRAPVEVLAAPYTLVTLQLTTGSSPPASVDLSDVTLSMDGGTAVAPVYMSEKPPALKPYAEYKAQLVFPVAVGRQAILKFSSPLRPMTLTAYMPSVPDAASKYALGLAANPALSGLVGEVAFHSDKLQWAPYGSQMPPGIPASLDPFVRPLTEPWIKENLGAASPLLGKGYTYLVISFSNDTPAVVQLEPDAFAISSSRTGNWLKPLGFLHLHPPYVFEDYNGYFVYPGHAVQTLVVYPSDPG